ncbi:MAG: hypothetical protein LBP19_05375 [Treponema sp.]|nr:hypothetical protein [Treponema sp.]
MWQSDDTDIIKDGEVIATQWLSDYSGYNYGIALYSDDSKYISQFQIRIDTGVALTQARIGRVSTIIKTQLPAYINIFIGYFDGTNFITYREIF